MTWLEGAPVLIGVLAVVLVPGALVLGVMGVRGLPLLALAAPVSVAVLAGGAVVLGLLGVGWSLPAAVGVCFLASLVAAVVRWRLPAPGALLERAPGPLGGLLTGLGLCVAAVVGALPLAAAMQRLDKVPQTYDSVFHLNAVRYVAETGAASSLELGGMVNTVTHTGFYPAGWHVLAATVLELTGSDIAAIANAMTLVLAGLVVPSSAALATRMLTRWRWAAAVGAVTGSLFTALPTLMVSYGTVWPNAWATGVLGATLAAGLASLRRPSVSSWLIVLVCVAGAALLHPAAVFGIVLLGLPPAVSALLRRWRVQLDTGRGRRLVGEASVGALIVVGLLLLAVSSSLLTAVRERVRTPAETLAEAVGEGLLDSPLSLRDYGVGDASWLLGALVVVGVLSASRVRGQRPWVVSWLFALTAYAVSAGADVDSGWREYLTGYWYNDPVRLAGQLVVVAAPLAALGLQAVVGWLRVPVERRLLALRGDRSGAALRAAALLGVPVVVAALLLATGGYADKRESRLAYDYWTPVDDPYRQLVTPAEEVLLRDIGDHLPEGAVLLADPFSGGALAYALGDRDVVFTHMAGTWSPAALRAIRLMPDLQGACGTLADLGVTHLYIDERSYFQDGRGQREYRNLDERPSSGLTLLAQADGASLYEVTGCSPGPTD